MRRKVLGVVLVLAGYGVAGALGGAIVGTFFAMVVAMIAIRDYLRKPQEHIGRQDSLAIRNYVPTALIGVVCSAILVNVDIFFAAQYLSHTDASIYSAASVLGKVIWFLPSAISIVVFPKLSEAHTKQLGTVPLMRRALFWTVGLTGLVALAYVLFPGAILQILYGGVYVDAAPALAILGVAMAFFGLSGLFMNLGLATENRVQIGIFVAFAALQIALIMLFHDRPTTIAIDLLATSVGLFVTSWAHMELRHRGFGA